MRRQLVDTTPLAALLSNRPTLVSHLSAALAQDELATSIVVYGEVLERIKGASDFARRRADLRRQLRPPHGPDLIGDIDTLIAATAQTYNLEVITTDGDFLRVPGLRVLLLDRTTFQPVAR